MKKLSIAILAMTLAWSCGKDDSPTPPKDTNAVPVIKAQEFTAFEGITDTKVIGTVAATDADKDTLTFSIKTNDSNLFEITAAGDLSLATGKTLDFATKAQHVITVEVGDGEDSATAEMTIKVTQTAPQNNAPEMEAQEFTVAEDITDTDVIGTVVATDADGDELTFGMFDDVSGLFEITTAGELSLKAGKSLDFETATQHVILVEVGDGIELAETTATVTIKVTDVDDGETGLADDPASFITTWETTTDNEEIIIGTNSEYTYNYAIDWGDGTVEQITSNADATHEYATAGIYTVAIKGDFPAIVGYTDNSSRTLEKLLSIEQWGTGQWKSMASAFDGCSNMVHNATDMPDLSQVTNMANMFSGVTSFNGDISGWDTSNVTVMSGMFFYTSSFNGDISGWDTSSVTHMVYMFYGAAAFNGDISGWDTSSVTNMRSMFYRATSFNGDLSGWDTSNVTDMLGMFFDATSFNQDLNSWDTSSVTNMRSMFEGAAAFDQNIGGWDLSSVTNMQYMLDGSGMSKANLRDTLEGWSTFVTNNNGPNDIELGMDGLTSCTEANNAFQNLSNNYGWTYTGTVGFQANCNDF